jgi:Spy/CpxP family protein refolding chaperone
VTAKRIPPQRDKIEQMARGFDSKFVEAQQEEATRDKKVGPTLTPEQRDRLTQRRAAEMSRARAVADLSRATSPAHKQMLGQAIAALDEQLNGLPVDW